MSIHFRVERRTLESHKALADLFSNGQTSLKRQPFRSKLIKFLEGTSETMEKTF